MASGGSGMTEHDDERARAFGFAPVDPAASSDRARKLRLLRRVADALQVSEASLYGIVDPPSPIEATDPGCDIDGQCAALLLAFRRIADPEERRRLLALVEAIAERA